MRPKMKKRFIKYSCLIAVLINIMACQSQNAITKLKASDFEKAIQQPQIQLLDVRTLEEYKAGHIQNSILGSINDAASYEKALSVLDKNKTVYVYCLAGGRSHNAAEDMLSKGFKQVIELDGGMNAWRKAALNEEKSGSSEELSVERFKTELPQTGTVLICVQSKYCGPCVKMKPVIESIEKEQSQLKVIKVDGGIDQQVMKSLNVSEIPVFIVMKAGKESFRHTGLIEKADLLKQIQ